MFLCFLPLSLVTKKNISYWHCIRFWHCQSFRLLNVFSQPSCQSACAGTPLSVPSTMGLPLWISASISSTELILPWSIFNVSIFIFLKIIFFLIKIYIHVCTLSSFKLDFKLETQSPLIWHQSWINDEEVRIWPKNNTRSENEYWSYIVISHSQGSLTAWCIYAIGHLHVMRYFLCSLLLVV